MGEYVLRLLVMLPLLGGLAWASLWLWKKVQLGLPQTHGRTRAVKVVDAVPMGTAGRLAVVEFAGRTLLVAASRQGITLLAEGEGDFADD